jgi:hypothetical protein
VWLREGIASGRVEINTPKARLHVLPEGLALVSPGIFRDFDAVHWDRAQKRLQKLKHHRKLPDGTNIWTCRVAKERKRSLIRAILIPDAEGVLGVRLPPPNPVVTLVTGAQAGPEDPGALRDPHQAATPTTTTLTARWTSSPRTPTGWPRPRWRC